MLPLNPTAVGSHSLHFLLLPIILLSLSSSCLCIGQIENESGPPVSGDTDTYAHTLCVMADNNGQCSLCTSCYPLSYYMENVDKYFKKDTKMIFLNGTHTAYTDVQLKYIRNFAMVGEGGFTHVPYYHSGENITLSEANSIIQCKGNWSSFNFSWVIDIKIENLTFIDCSGTDARYKGPLIFEMAWNVNLSRVTVRNNIGYGLHGFQMYGSININSCVFRNNSGKGSLIGGNALLWFSSCTTENCSTQVNIFDSYFLDGSTQHQEDYSHYHSYATGLKMEVNCSNVTIIIRRTTWINNHIDEDDKKAIDGGNVAIIVLVTPTSVVHITDSRIISGSGFRGGGLKIYPFLPRLDTGSGTQRTVELRNVIFKSNRARKGGGALYISTAQSEKYQATTVIRIVNCNFTDNSVPDNGSGAVAEIIKHDLPRYLRHVSKQFQIVFKNCVFHQNTLKCIDPTCNRVQGGIIDVYFVEKIVFKNCNFTDNNSTALSLVDSNVHFSGKIRFENNRAINGGALKFCQLSAMYIENETHIYFHNNHATASGGAIFAESPCSATASPCFYQPIVDNSTSLSNISIQLEFVNNKADYAGDAVYGGSVETCFIYNKICGRYSSCHYYYNTLFKELFDLTRQTGTSNVSSEPIDICICGVNSTPNCSVRNYTLPRGVYPGEEFNISAVVVGQMNGSRPGFIRSKVERGNVRILHNYMEVTQINDTSCGNITLAVDYRKSQVVLNLSVEQMDPTTQSFYYYSEPQLVTVRFNHCPWGFCLDAHQSTCQCACLLWQYNVNCFISNQTVQREGPYWIGKYNCSRNETCDVVHSHYPHCSSNKTCDGVVVHSHCPYDYCKRETETIYLNATTLDSQCANNREGTLCGRCRDGYSTILGSSQCKKCSYTNALLVPVFLVMGIVLVVLLVLLKLTVSVGTINGLIFYANFVQINRSIYFPPQGISWLSKLSSIFIAWLNLDWGIEICFFDSMDAYTKNWLQFAFPVYIWIIAGVIIILCRKSTTVARLVGKNAVQVLATLFLLSYAKLIRATIMAYQFTVVKHGQHKILVWLPDANIKFFATKRIPLLLLGLFFGIASLLYATVLTFSSCLQKHSNLRGLYWVRRLKPFFDAHTGPHKDRYGFWTGVMFLVRIFSFTAFSCNVLGQPDLNMYLTTVTCLLILLAAWCLGGVYRNPRIDILEAIYVFNLAVLSISTMASSYYPNQPKLQKATLYSSVLLALLLFFGIITYHCFRRLMEYEGLQELLQWVQRKHLELGENREEIRSLVESPQIEDRPPLQQTMPPVRRYNRYREDILEHEDS